MGRWLARALSTSQWLHHRAFEQATRRPELAQARLLGRILNNGARTAFGREHGLAADLTPRGYARRVPIRDYEGLRPWMARAVAGEPAVLTAEPPVAFASTSGTTGEPKLVPVTPSSARAMARAMRLWTFHALRDHPALLDHRVLTLVGAAEEDRTPGGLPVGAMTGLAYRRLPWLVRRRHALPETLALVRDHETRYFLSLRLALGHRVSSIGTPNPSTLLRLAEVAARRGEALVRAIRDGALGVDDVEPIPGAGLDTGALRAALAAGLAPDPARAAALAATGAREGALRLGRCWPDLVLVGCWLGGAAGIQARHLDAHFPGVARRDLGLIASEGRLTIPLSDDSPAGVLALDACFFEFVAEEDADDPAPPVRLCHEVEDGRRYHAVITTAGGLYRYDLNDVVEVRGFHHRTPCVAFVRKGRDMLSITGEKLHLNHVLHAVRAAEAAAGLGLWQFRLIADADDARYDLLVEPARPPAAAALPAFARAFDAALADVNAEYASKRASGRLRPPRLCVMRAGWSERVCRDEVAAGRRESQHKWSAMRAGWDATSRDDVVTRIAPDGDRPAPSAAAARGRS